MSRIRINENGIRKIISESLKKVINESMFFHGSDPEFPKDLAKSIKAIAEANGVNFEYKGDYVKVSVKFRDEMAWYTTSELYAVKTNEDGTLNYWTCVIGPSGRQHNSGPGYPDTAVHGQTPVSKDEYLNMIGHNIKHLAGYTR